MEKPAASGCSWKENSLPWKKITQLLLVAESGARALVYVSVLFIAGMLACSVFQVHPTIRGQLCICCLPQQPRSNVYGAVLYLSKMKNVGHCIYSWRKIRKWALFSSRWGKRFFTIRNLCSAFLWLWELHRVSLLRDLTQELLSLWKLHSCTLEKGQAESCVAEQGGEESKRGCQMKPGFKSNLWLMVKA